MKKLSYILTGAFALFAMTSCSIDKDPKYHAPTEGSFSLYAPVLQDQYIELTEGATLGLTTSGQPDYGYSAVANYSAQMSLSSYFSNPDAIYDLSPIDNHQSNMTFKQEDVAIGVCVLYGLESEDDYLSRFPNGMPDIPVYFRAVCELNGVEGSRIVSNVVSYNHITPYFAVAVPGYIYLVGNVTGWNEPSQGNASYYANWRLFEPDNAIGSKVYSGVFDIEAAPMFRFYTDLTGWDADSYGYIVDDNATDFPDFTGASSWTQSLIKGKGAYSFPNFPGGQVTIIVDMSVDNNMTVTISPGAVEVFVPKYIYMMGSIQGWTEPTEANAAAYEDYKLFNSSSAEAVYTGSFAVSEGEQYIRFAYELAGWDAGQWGIQEPDESVDCSFSNNTFSSPYVQGKGSWKFVTPSAGRIDIAVDTDNTTATFTFVPEA